MDVQALMESKARAARAAAAVLALTPTRVKNEALQQMASGLEEKAAALVETNRGDVERARGQGASRAFLDRLTLTESRIHGMAEGLREIAALPDPVGTVVDAWRRPSGIEIARVRVPLGVIGFIYESRPNVTADAAGLCLKSGNAVILRGGSAAADTNRATVEVLRESLAAQGLPADAVGLLEGGHGAVRALMTARGLVDLLIPRGGADLIRTVVTESTVPVIETGVGNCHVYVDRAADLDKALAITVNSKTHRPSVCNAAESLLVHRDVAAEFLPKALAALAGEGVALHTDADAGAQADVAGVAHDAVTDEHFATEFHGLELSVGVVDDLDAALEHIRRFGSGHTEAIVTEDRAAARRFTAEVDAAAVMVNASTRFTDGGEFGFGAEIGISTQKLHARGPMALPELTTTKWVVEGDGQIRV